MVTVVQMYPLTVTLVTVTQYRAMWLQWYFSEFSIDQFYTGEVAYSDTGYSGTVYSQLVTVTLF